MVSNLYCRSFNFGFYFCVSRLIIISQFLFSLVLPKINPFDFGDGPIFSGQSAQASCFVSEGTEPVSISWIFQGKNVSSVSEIYVTTIGKKASILIIEPAGYKHRGAYTCLASNSAGVTNYTAILNINGTSFIDSFTTLSCFIFL